MIEYSLVLQEMEDVSIQLRISLLQKLNDIDVGLEQEPHAVELIINGHILEFILKLCYFVLLLIVDHHHPLQLFLLFARVLGPHRLVTRVLTRAIKSAVQGLVLQCLASSIVSFGVYIALLGIIIFFQALCLRLLGASETCAHASRR